MKKSSIQEVQGGDIGRSYYVETKERKWFVKYRTDLSSLVFQREAEGLALLRETGAVAVPETYTVLTCKKPLNMISDNKRSEG